MNHGTAKHINGVLNDIRAERDQARAQRDFYIKLFNRLEVAVTHHKKRKEDKEYFIDEADEYLYKARDQVLKSAHVGPES